MNALYDGRGDPVFPEEVPALITEKAKHCIVAFDVLQYPAWVGGSVDLILQLSDVFSSLPRHYLEHIAVFLISGGFVAVQGDDLDAVVDAVETINAAAAAAERHRNDRLPV